MRYIIIILSIYFVCFTSSCSSVGCEHNGPVDYGLNAKLFNKVDGFNLIGKFNGIYDSDKVKFTYENGDSIPYSNINGAGDISFLSVLDYEEGLSGDVVERYLLHLPDSSFTNNFDIDTIELHYSLSKNTDNCPEVWYQYFNLYYNGEKYNEGDFQNKTYVFYKFPE